MSGIASLRGVIRIVLAGVPSLMAAVVKDAIASDAGMVVVAEVDNAGNLPVSLGERDFDVIMTALKHGETDVDPAFQRLLFHFPHVCVIAFSGGGRRMEIFDRNVVREVAPQQIPGVIREIKARNS